ncbi:MAG: 6-pyruvoyl-tetrahydropterin synthase-related protein, partial [Vicinamibacteria bacterium]|nr:6-pyruvoyl-tetrahydropterin synthase-related protein [Vicinamibacteria bacterium]
MRQRLIAVLARLGGSLILRMAALYLLQSLISTWPLALRIGDHVIGHTLRESTPPLNAWAIGQVLRQLPSHPLALFDGNVFYPYKNTLAYSEHLFVPALLGAPTYYLTHNLVLTYNVVTLLMLTLAGLGMFLFARELSGSGLAAWAAGSLYAFHTWNINELVRLQIVSNAFFPFLLLALLRFYQRPDRRKALGAAVAAALQGLSCMYWALYLPLLLAPALLLLWRRSGRSLREQRPLLLALTVAALPMLLFLIPYLITARDLALTRELPLSLPLANYWAILPSNIIYGGWLPTARFDQLAAHFLGFSALALALCALWPRPGDTAATRWARPGLIAMIVVGGIMSL